MTWHDILDLAALYPGAELGSCYGTPGLRVRGKLLTRYRPEDDSLVLLEIPPDERALLIDANPATFHVTPHYENYPAMLARLGPLQPAQARHFLDRRYRCIAGPRLLKTWDRA